MKRFVFAIVLVLCSTIAIRANFFFPDPLPAPTEYTATATETGSTVTFSWSPVTGADRYYLWVNEITPGDMHSGVIQDDEITDTEYVAIRPFFGKEHHEYEWRVSAISAGDEQGTWPAVKKFWIAPDKPTLTAPSGTLSNTSVTFQWSAVDHVLNYELCVNDTTDTSDEVTRVIHVKNISSMSTSYSDSTSLEVDHDYAWTVRAILGDGTKAPWAVRKVFSIE